MLHSERSSLSSFRDYYDHSSSRMKKTQEEQMLLVGLRRFMIRKVMSSVDRSIRDKQYWLKVYAFKVLHSEKSKSDKRMQARKALHSVMLKISTKQSRSGVINHYLERMMEGMKADKECEVQQFATIASVMGKKINRSLSDGFHSILKQPSLRKHLQSVVRKLIKANLAIHWRNIMYRLLLAPFRSIVNAGITQAQLQGDQSRGEKSKQHVRISENNQTSKISSKAKLALSLVAVVNRKILHLQNDFFTRLNSSKQLSPASSQVGDSAEIMANVVTHMIYLTGQLNSHKTPKQLVDENVKAKKLMRLCRKWSRKERKGMLSCLLAWRRASSQDNVTLARKINQLQEIKAKYLDG